MPRRWMPRCRRRDDGTGRMREWVTEPLPRSERRRQLDGERAEVREAEVVDAVERAVVQLTARGAGAGAPDFRVIATILGPRVEIPAHEAERPVPLSTH